MNGSIKIPSGKYKHYKGGKYNVYSVVKDQYGEEYVLYQQDYGEKGFWIRPVESFKEIIETEQIKTPRFQMLGKQVPTQQKVDELAEILRKKDIKIRHSETERLYCLPAINTNNKEIIVYELDQRNSSGYLTEYELAQRMGFSICKIDDELRIIEGKPYTKDKQLHIGNNDIEILRNQFNPCSIDLKIAESGFLRTRHKVLNIGSIEHPVKATTLWKSVKVYTNTSGDYIKLRPKCTILTHTKEKLGIPSDCAGKIEIKSTYARLSLSITMGDFCNPGYRGFFPLEITNHGNHTIILHAGETMAQLMLIPLTGPIINQYTQKATFINGNGEDDGNPFTFYRERALKLFRKTNGAEKIITLYQRLYSSIQSSNVDDINSYRARFENDFLTYCQRNIKKKKNLKNQEPDIKKILNGYIESEKVKKKLSNIPIWTGILTGLGLLIEIGSAIIQILPNMTKENFIKEITANKTKLILIAIAMLVIFFWSYMKKNKEYCTFEKIDIKPILESIELESAEKESNKNV